MSSFENYLYEMARNYPNDYDLGYIVTYLNINGIINLDVIVSKYPNYYDLGREIRKITKRAQINEDVSN